MVVVVAGGGIYAAETGKRKPDFFLGGGLPALPVSPITVPLNLERLYAPILP